MRNNGKKGKRGMQTNETKSAGMKPTGMKPTGPWTRTVAITCAELHKMMSKRGGIRSWMTGACIVGIIMTAATMAMGHDRELQASLGIGVSTVVSSMNSAIICVLALAACSYVTREVQDGTIGTAQTIVPLRGALFTARLLAWSLIATAMILIASTICVLVALADSATRRGSIGGVAATVCANIVVAWVVLAFAHCLALALGRGASVVAVLFLLFAVIPLVLFIVGIVVPGAPQWVSRINSAMPGHLMMAALNTPGDAVSSAASAGWGKVWSSAGWLACWSAGVGAAAYARFRSPLYGEPKA